MIPISFDYTRSTSVDDALAALTSGDAKLLSGGQSLLPAMKLRLNAPGLLVDIAKIPALQGIRQEGNELVIGAAATHAAIAASDLVKNTIPILAQGAGLIGDPSVRNKGTLGGSLAHADPSADWPALILVTNATVVCQSTSGSRTVAASDFFTDLYATALEDGELITEVRFPIVASAKMSYQKFLQPASRFAIVGCAVARYPDGTTHVVFTGAASHAYHAVEVEKALAGKELTAENIATAVEQVASGSILLNGGRGLEPLSDHYASTEYRVHLAKVYCKRALSAIA
ncbi:MAG: xanthine dehydrogenase family protein subunit M [Spirosomataceae bacterium]